MIKVLVGVALGFFLFSNPDARQVTADVTRAAADTLAPEQDDKTFQNRLKGRMPWKKDKGSMRTFLLPHLLLPIMSVKLAELEIKCLKQNNLETR